MLGGVVTVLVVWAVVVVCRWWGHGGVARAANTRTLMDAETGVLVQVEIQPDWGPFPHVNPQTGQRTLYPVEWCFNGECGKAGGTPVILNALRGKPNEPTVCPRCGARVRMHNPRTGEAASASPGRD